MPVPRFLRLGLFADMEQSAKFARIDAQIDEAQAAARRGVTDSCVTDVPNAPFEPVRVASLPQTAWPIAYPEWDDLTTAEHDEHRQTCEGECGVCDGFRAWGACPTCGSTNAEANDAGDSVCCAARVLFGVAAERAYSA